MTETETRELVNLFKQKPEIDNQISFYKETMQAVVDAVKGVELRLKYGSGDKFFYLIFGFIPVFKREILDKYRRAKLTLELKDLENELFRKKEYFEHWLARARDYDAQFTVKLEECNKHFDFVYTEAEQVAETNLRLRTHMANYKNPDNDNKLKVEYYLFMKQEVENNYKSRGRKFKLPEFVVENKELKV